MKRANDDDCRILAFSSSHPQQLQKQKKRRKRIPPEYHQQHQQQVRCQRQLLILKNHAIFAFLLIFMLWNTPVHGFPALQQHQQHSRRQPLHAAIYHSHRSHDTSESRKTGISSSSLSSSFEDTDEKKMGESDMKDGALFQMLPLQTSNRRNMLHSLAVATSLALLPTRSCLAAPPSTTTIPSTTTTSSTVTFISPDQAVVTDKVYMNVRISRQDGTFYVRDDLPDTPENKVFYGRLVFGLFGQEAPRHVEKFKSYLVPPKTTSSTTTMDDDSTLPSYDRSTFTSFDQATGVLMGGKIPSLELTEISGSTALRYGGRLLPASLWLEQRSSSSSNSNDSNKPRVIISHSARGLLTHRQLESLPDFGITTRTDTTMLDRTHVVFGKLILDDDAQAFLNIVSNLPTYGMERPNPYNNNDMIEDDNPDAVPALVDDAAAAVFKAQRQFFRKTAKAFGDSRLDKLYEGKLLRRVEVTSTGIV